MSRSDVSHRPDEFALPSLPSHILVYTRPDCSLKELALELAAVQPSILPSPSIGTRLVFQLVCPDLRGTSAINNAAPRFAVKELGSIVIGQGSLSVRDLEDAEIPVTGDRENGKTLREAHFVVGDYVSCAVLPPLSDGSVAPAMNARRESSAAGRGGPRGHRGGFQGPDDGFGRLGEGRGGRDGWRNGGGSSVPLGEWRRGERLPDGPARRSRGRGRW